MSRHLISAHSRVPSAADNNPYQPTTVPHIHQHRVPKGVTYCRNGGATTIDTGLSDGTFTDSQSYYDYYYHGRERSFSDDSGSTRLPCYLDEESRARTSRNTFSSDRSHGGRKIREGVNSDIHKDTRRVYPQQYAAPDAGVYHDLNHPQAICDNAPRRLPPASRLSDRPQSSMSSGVTSAIVDGCGGKCQTFENVCYFFLQLVFMMGILIGVSLCIAGLVLRKSAARNLQVLVYIGIMLAVVSCVLLGIQWNARTMAKRRKMAVRCAKRAPIPMETLNPRHPQQQVQPLMAMQDGQRVVPQVVRSVPPVQDQQGIPWWRRKDLI